MAAPSDFERLVEMINAHPYRVISRRMRFDVSYDDVFVQAELTKTSLRLMAASGKVREVTLADVCRIDFMHSCVRLMYLVEATIQISGSWYETGHNEMDGVILALAA